jgi:uncharacterized protein
MSSTPDHLTFINTSPLLYLHQVRLLEILPKLYGTVIAPSAVEQELAVGRAKGIAVPDLNLLNWLQIRVIDLASTIPNVIDLGRGEAEVIALGIENPNSLLILDDQLGRRIATLYQLRYTGTLGVLIKAKQAGYLAAIAPVIRELQAQGMWLTESVIQTVLKLAQEIE